jgi:hypothetical protein
MLPPDAESAMIRTAEGAPADRHDYLRERADYRENGPDGIRTEIVETVERVDSPGPHHLKKSPGKRRVSGNKSCGSM